MSYHITAELKSGLKSLVDEPDELPDQTSLVELLLALVQLDANEELNFVPNYMPEAARRGDNGSLPHAVRVILENGRASVVVRELLDAGFLGGSETALDSALRRHEQFLKEKAGWLVDLTY